MRAEITSITGVICAAIMLTACASTTPQDAPKTLIAHTGLVAQELAQGECGIFFWTLSSPPVFTFFQKQGERTAKFYHEAAQTTLTTQANTQSLGDTPTLDIIYKTEAGNTVRIKGQFADIFTDTLDGGRRITSGAIQTTTSENWQEITPVSGVYVCR
ncbi:MAG: hypothetical protein COA69_04260 [Robiginitomaculum sp.]|nr:MAG: hypothetical protein COA69_04260 [Robiginitomaculum sp.]